jgi:hypothetical protein
MPEIPDRGQQNIAPGLLRQKNMINVINIQKIHKST